MPWSVLKSADDWRAYRDRLRAEADLPSAMHIQFGKGPPAYPCLATTTFLGMGDPRFLSCYVLPEEAAQLIAAAGPPAAPEDWRGILKNIYEEMAALSRRLPPAPV